MFARSHLPPSAALHLLGRLPFLLAPYCGCLLSIFLFFLHWNSTLLATVTIPSRCIVFACLIAFGLRLCSCPLQYLTVLGSLRISLAFLWLSSRSYGIKLFLPSDQTQLQTFTYRHTQALLYCIARTAFHPLQICARTNPWFTSITAVVSRRQKLAWKRLYVKGPRNETQTKSWTGQNLELYKTRKQRCELSQILQFIVGPKSIISNLVKPKKLRSLNKRKLAKWNKM